MKKAYVFLATGFEETEALGTVDVLRRAELPVETVSITGQHAVTGAHHVTIEADSLFEDVCLKDALALVLPGGLPGATNLNDFEPLRAALKKQYEEGRVVAAICAAPMVLGGLDMVSGRRATCYPSFEKYLPGAHTCGADVEVDGNVITGKGPALVFKFGTAIVAALCGAEKADEVAAGLLM